IKQLLEYRGEIYSYNDETFSIEANLEILSSLFNNRNISFKEKDLISIKTDEVNFSMRFVKFIEEEVVEKTSEGTEVIFTKKSILPGDSNNDDLLYGLELKVDNISQMLLLDRQLFRRRSFTFESSNFHLINSKGDDIDNNAILWDKITLSEKEDLVIEALKIIEPDISRLSFVGNDTYKNPRYPIIKLNNAKNIYPLKAMGDGINRILNLTLALVNSDNGFLLIDEFENGLHHSVQEKLWEIIFEISSKLNIQVFATTHSNDSINAFARVLESKKEFDGALYRLERKKEKVISNQFSKEEITEAANQGINLR
ncbi:MAG: ATP-binding protein, partial [Bacteroidales bacterium]|nr:ATP-binding protein [Bacteroidales bacterium]